MKETVTLEAKDVKAIIAKFQWFIPECLQK